MASISEKKAELIVSTEDIFKNGVADADDQLARAILAIYAKFVVDGNLVLNVEQLAQVEDAIIKAIAKTDYSKAVNTYIPSFDAIEGMNKRLHKEVNDININTLINENDKIVNFKNTVISQLKATPSTTIQVTTVVDGIKQVNKVAVRNASLDALVNPIAEVIRKDVITGISFDAASESILNAIDKKQLGLGQWSGQISRDALSQSDGITQNEIRKEYDFEFLSYQGLIMGTTRPFCYHLKNMGDRIPKEQVEMALNEYIPGGIPSDSTTSKTANGKPQKKGGGMIPGTNIDNFTIYRGGYNCHHDAVWVRK